MAKKLDKDVGIVIDLLVDAQSFVNDITTALNTGVSTTKNSANQIQNILNNAFSLKNVDTKAFSEFDAKLKNIQKSADQLGEAFASGDVSDGLLQIKVSADEVSAAWLRIDERAKATHRSANQAANVLVKNNEISAAAAQQALEANSRQLLTEKQLESAAKSLSAEMIKLHGDMTSALNISPAVEKDIQELVKLQSKIDESRSFYNQLAGATGGTWKSNTAAITTPNVQLGNQIKQQANALGQRPQDIAIGMGETGAYGIQELQAALLGAANGADMYLLSSKEVNQILAAQEKLAQNATLKISELTLADKAAAEASALLAQKKLEEAEAERLANIEATEKRADIDQTALLEAEIAKRKENAAAQAQFNAEEAKAIAKIDEWEAKTTAKQAREDAILAKKQAATQAEIEAANAKRLAEVNAANEAMAAEQRQAQANQANAEMNVRLKAAYQAKAQAIIDKINEEQRAVTSLMGTQNKQNKIYQDIYNSIAKILGLPPIKAPDPAGITIYKERLKENIAAIEQLKASTLGWGEASKRIFSTNDVQLAQTGNLIKNIASQLGTNVQTAAQVAIASGQTTVANAQNYLANSGNNLALSQQQVTTAVNVQTQAVQGNTVALGNLNQVHQQVVQGNKTTQNALNGTTQAAQNAKSGFQGMVDGVTKIMGQLLLLQYVLTPVIQAIQEATKAYLDLSKAQFALQSGVKATQSQIGAAAGTYDQWQATIKKLANQFPQFSEVAITKGIANIVKLQASLGFTQEKMQDLIQAGVALAQMSGEDLGAALQDIVQAMGGSSVVLDKYGIFIRDADKNTSALAKSIGKTTDQMTSQELALATLEAILNKTNPLLANMGDYNQTMGGKIAIANATIEESYAKLGEATSQFDLYFKNLYATMLENIIKNIPYFQQLLDIIRNINNATGQQAINSAIINEQKLNPFTKYQLEQGKTNEDITKLQQRSSYLSDNPIPGLTENANDFGALNLDTSRAKVKEYETLINQVEALNTKIREEKFKGGETGDWEKQRDEILNKLDKDYLDTRRFLEYSKNFIRMLFPDLKGEEFNNKLEEFRNEYSLALEKVYAKAHPYKETEVRPGQAFFKGKAKEEIDPKVLDKLKKYYQDIVDMTTDYNNTMADMRLKRTQDENKAQNDRDKALRDSQTQLGRDLNKADRDAEFDRQKLLFKYNNDLADIDENAAKDKKKKEQEFQDKSREAWEDYYKELRLLNQEYLMDLRDAVADNDAVAIKRLERKYNLDKAKIDERLKDRLSTEQKNLNKSNDQIDQDVQDKKAKLKKNYDDDLTLIQMNLDKQRQEINIKYNEQNLDIEQKLKDKNDEIAQNFKDERALQDQHYNQKLADLGIKLAQEDKAVLDHLQTLLGDYKKYFGDNGEILTLMQGFYDEQKALSTSSIAAQTGYKNIINDKDFQKYFKDTYGIDINNLTPKTTLTPTPLKPQPFAPVEFNNTGENAPIQVQFSSDGTIPEQFYDIIAERTITDITSAIGNIIIKAQ